MPSIELMLNGSPRAIDFREGATLLDLLRERCGLSSAKNGCSPTGQSGCCTALVDGQATVACAFPAERSADSSVVTLDASATRALPGVYKGSSIPTGRSSSPEELPVERGVTENPPLRDGVGRLRLLVKDPPAARYIMAIEEKRA